MNYRLIAKVVGLVLIIVGASMSFSAGWGFYYKERAVWGIIAGMAITLATGGLAYGLTWREGSDLRRRDGLAIVSFSWIFAGIFGALPFIFSGDLSAPDAIFETVSGFTTTGSSLLTDIEAFPKCLLFWRSFTHWLGGMGIVVLFIAIMSFLGVGARQLYKSESPGPISEGLRPKIHDTTRWLWSVYMTMSLMETILLCLLDMPLFDALCHTFGTMATGGFSTKNASIGHYESSAVHVVIAVFMFLAGANFALHYQAVKGDFRGYFKDAEFLAYTGIMAGAILFVYVVLLLHGHYREAPLIGLRDSAFQTVSIVTTTGYGTADFDKWPNLLRFSMVLFMWLGGCSGSTGGGMKIIRIMVLWKVGVHFIRKIYHPEAVIPVRLGKMVIKDEVKGQILTFLLLAILIFLGSSMAILAIEDVSLETATSAVVATLWNIGPGLDQVGATQNFHFFSAPSKLLFSLLMIMGRLEIFTVIVLFSPSFWKRAG